MVSFRSKRTQRGVKRYPVNQQSEMERLLRMGLSPDEARRVIAEERKGFESAFSGHPHPGEELEHAQAPAVPPNVTVQPPISITVQSGAGGPAQPAPAPREPLAPSIVPIATQPKLTNYPPHILEGDVDTVSAGLYGAQYGVEDVKVKGLRKNRIEVMTFDGTKFTYKKKTDRKGAIHWTRKDPKPTEDDDDDHESESDGNFWDTKNEHESIWD